MAVARLIWLVRLEVIVFLGGLSAIIAYRLLTGGINTKYLLYGTQKDGTKYFSPERVQLLLVTLWVAVSYLIQVAHSISGADPSKLAMPEIPAKTLALLGGGHAIYLGGKAYTMLFKKIVKGE